MGNHKGRPYGRLVGAYFRSNDRDGDAFSSMESGAIVKPTPVSPAGERYREGGFAIQLTKTEQLCSLVRDGGLYAKASILAGLPTVIA